MCIDYINLPMPYVRIVSTASRSYYAATHFKEIKPAPRDSLFWNAIRWRHQRLQESVKKRHRFAASDDGEQKKKSSSSGPYLVELFAHYRHHAITVPDASLGYLRQTHEKPPKIMVAYSAALKARRHLQCILFCGKDHLLARD